MGYSDEVGAYVAKADFLFKGLLQALAPLYKEEHGIEQEATIPLFTALHSTSESILILLYNQAIFDADILLRTVMEGTIKYCYLMMGTPEERNDKYIEYKEKLTDLDKLSDHRKAKETIRILQEFYANSTKPFEYSILDENELKRLQEIYPHKVRDEIKRKWNYQALLRAIAKNSSEYEAQIGTLSTYSFTSHFCHCDWTGVSTRQAQIEDSLTDQSEIFDIGHAVRIIANALSMYIFRVAEYMRCNQFKSQKAVELSLEALDFACALGERGNEIITENS